MKKKALLIIIVLFAYFTLGYSTSPYKINIGRHSSRMPSNKTIVVNDPKYKEQWNIKFTNSDEAWKIMHQKREVSIAVVDSGIDYNNSELKNRIAKDKGYNFVNNTKDATDDFGHGTEVAGVIAAEQGNSKGITGVVGPTDVKIIPVKVLDENGEGNSEIIAKGIVYAAEVGADIINVSIDFDVHDKAIQDAINYAKNKGSFVVVAAGNTNSNCDLYSPAGDTGAYAVASINTSYKKSDFSSYGNSVQVAAPGEDILTTELQGQYDLESGTSMATPIVSGIAAMIKAERPELGPDAIARIIDVTATDIMTKGKDVQTGYGLIDAYKAVKMARKKL